MKIKSIKDRIENIVTNSRGYDFSTSYSRMETLTEEELQSHLEEMEKPKLCKVSKECLDYFKTMYNDDPGAC